MAKINKENLIKKVQASLRALMVLSPMVVLCNRDADETVKMIDEITEEEAVKIVDTLLEEIEKEER